MPRSVMDGTTVGNKLAALRAEDGLVRERLAEVDAKLAKWMEAVRAAEAAVHEQATAAPVRARLSTRPAQAPPDAEQGRREQPAEPANAEALLKTLDPDTANAIRVKRRLSKDKRDVRELLEELRSMRQSPAQAGPERKRWWRRKNEQ